MAGMPRGRWHKGGKPPCERNRGMSEMKVPFNPISISTSVATGASSAMRLKDHSSFGNTIFELWIIWFTSWEFIFSNSLSYTKLLITIYYWSYLFVFFITSSKAKPCIHYHLVDLIHCRYPLFHSNKLQH